MSKPRKTRATPETIRATEFARLEAELACAVPSAAKSVTHCAGTTGGYYAGPKAAPLRPGANLCNRIECALNPSTEGALL